MPQRSIFQSQLKYCNTLTPATYSNFPALHLFKPTLSLLNEYDKNSLSVQLMPNFEGHGTRLGKESVRPEMFMAILTVYIGVFV